MKKSTKAFIFASTALGGYLGTQLGGWSNEEVTRARTILPVERVNLNSLTSKVNEFQTHKNVPAQEYDEAVRQMEIQEKRNYYLELQAQNKPVPWGLWVGLGIGLGLPLVIYGASKSPLTTDCD